MMDAWFEIDVECGALSLGADGLQGFDFSMWRTGSVMIALADNFAVLHDDGANHRIGIGPAQPSLGQLQSHIH